jgi:hypothetical protein
MKKEPILHNSKFSVQYSIFSILALCAMRSAICPPPAFATSYAKYRALDNFASEKRPMPDIPMHAFTDMAAYL